MNWIRAYQAAKRGDTDFVFEVSNRLHDHQVIALVKRIIVNREMVLDGLKALALAQWTADIPYAETNPTDEQIDLWTRDGWDRSQW